jgi:hypothetical protein
MCRWQNATKNGKEELSSNGEILVAEAFNEPSSSAKQIEELKDSFIFLKKSVNLKGFWRWCIANRITVQWLRSALSIGRKWAGVFSPLHLRTETDPLSKTSCFYSIEHRTMEKVRNPSNSEYSVLPHVPTHSLSLFDAMERLFKKFGSTKILFPETGWRKLEYSNMDIRCLWKFLLSQCWASSSRIIRVIAYFSQYHDSAFCKH